MNQIFKIILIVVSLFVLSSSAYSQTEFLTSGDFVKNTDKHWIIPKSFSPNNDGLNDVFKIYMIDKDIQYSCYIFDNQGKEVSHMNNHKPDWDGTCKTIPMPQGVYFYHCIINNTELNGQLYLIR